MKKSTLKTFSLLLLGIQFAAAQGLDAFFGKADSFFSTYVKDGKVDYRAIKNDPAQLNALLDLANELVVDKSDARNFQAFWINGYNLQVIKGIADHYPVKSPLDIKGFFDVTKREIGGKRITLNDIENKLLRGNFPKEARFHFVLVCAGLGCPPIIPNAYLPDTLEERLQVQTEKALNDPKFIQDKGKKVLLSQIFEWYTKDFTQGGKTLVEYVNQFREEQLLPKAKVGYYPYDWTLNSTKN